ncbi:MAG: hypothetical protein ACIALR_08845 [Blastopirellula sp. JB062]
MTSRRNSHILHPAYLAFGIILLGLSAAAPWLWQPTQSTSRNVRLAERSTSAPTPPAPVPPPEKQEPTPAQPTLAQPPRKKGEPTLAQPTLAQPRPEKGEPTPAKPPREQGVPTLAAPQRDSAPSEPTLADPDAMPQQAAIAPRVEQEFSLDLVQPLAFDLSPQPEIAAPATSVEPIAPTLPDLPRVAAPVRTEQAPTREPLVIAQPILASEPNGEIWPTSPQLQALATQVARHAECADWAAQLKDQLDQLAGLPLDSPDAATILDQLVRLHNEASSLAEQLGYSWKRTDMLQIGYALQRRLAVWRPLHQLAQRGALVEPTPLDPQPMAAPLSEVEATLRAGGELLSWSDYLSLNQIRSAMSPGYLDAERRMLARQTLARLDSPDLTDAQQQLLSQPAFAPFRQALTDWASADVSLGTTLAQIEQFEQSLAAPDANRLADSCQSLAHYQDPDLVQLATLIQQHYRNANCRVAVSASLIDALLPQMEPTEQAVDDQILGNRVLGHSRRETELKVRLSPDPLQWRVQLDVYGVVDSNTSSQSGPVTVFNRGRSHYQASKQVVVNPLGFWVSPATASAQTRTDINGLRTDYDKVPLLGSIVRSVARSKSEATQIEAQRVVESKVEQNASQQLDQGLNEKVELWQDKLLALAVEPLQSMGLDPAVVDMCTTEDQLIGRFRIASDMQLAAHTPRPVAFADSAFSMQLHESTLNNSVRRLDLAGRRYRLDDVVRQITARLHQVDDSLLDQIPAGVEVVFADENPVEIRAYDGKIEISVALAELTNGNRVYRNFRVFVAYSPEVDGLKARLVRDGTVKLDGAELGFGGQIALRAVFAKVFSKQRKLPIVPPQLADDPRLQAFELSQLALYDGWIALAISPKPAVAADVPQEPKVRVGQGAILRKLTR